MGSEGNVWIALIAMAVVIGVASSLLTRMWMKPPSRLEADDMKTTQTMLGALSNLNTGAKNHTESIRSLMEAMRSLMEAIRAMQKRIDAIEDETNQRREPENGYRG